jgi:hypothetical protein
MLEKYHFFGIQSEKVMLDGKKDLITINQFLDREYFYIGLIKNIYEK